MEERERRIGLNESLFREVNERVKDVNETFSVFTDQVHIVCECGDAMCTERLTLRAEEYEAVRSNAEHFAVAPGHVAPDVEHVIAEHEGWQLVRKDPGPAANVARATNPRGD